MQACHVGVGLHRPQMQMDNDENRNAIPFSPDIIEVRISLDSSIVQICIDIHLGGFYT